MLTKETVLGKVAVAGSEIFIRPASDKTVLAITTLAEEAGMVPEMVSKSNGDPIPPSLAVENDTGQVVKITLRPKKAEGEGDFTRFDGQDITFYDLAVTLG